jgi:hypothetical protein
MASPNENPAPKEPQKADCPSASCSLSLALNAYGTSNQLIVFLRNTADQIERDSTRHALPWFSIQNGGGFIGDFKVTSANS